jgi:hypothetical protein
MTREKFTENERGRERERDREWVGGEQGDKIGQILAC